MGLVIGARANRHTMSRPQRRTPTPRRSRPQGCRQPARAGRFENRFPRARARVEAVSWRMPHALRRLYQKPKERCPMAMTMNGEVQLPASREAVWAKLNDPEVLKSCIPGCEQLDMISTPSSRPSPPSRSARSRRAGRARCGSPTSIRPTATAFPAKARAASPASPRAAPRSRSPTRTAARCSPTTSRRRSAASSPSSASA